MDMTIDGMVTLLEISVIPDRGHSLIIDHGWQDVANVAEEFITRTLDRARVTLPG